MDFKETFLCGTGPGSPTLIWSHCAFNVKVINSLCSESQAIMEDNCKFYFLQY